MARARAAVYGVPVVTYTLIGINILVYLVVARVFPTMFSPLPGSYLVTPVPAHLYRWATPSTPLECSRVL